MSYRWSVYINHVNCKSLTRPRYDAKQGVSYRSKTSRRGSKLTMQLAWREKHQRLSWTGVIPRTYLVKNIKPIFKSRSFRHSTFTKLLNRNLPNHVMVFVSKERICLVHKSCRVTLRYPRYCCICTAKSQGMSV